MLWMKWMSFHSTKREEIDIYGTAGEESKQHDSD